LPRPRLPGRTAASRYGADWPDTRWLLCWLRCLTLLLASRRDQLNLTTDVLVFLVAVIAVALVGGLV
jgi:hypothetical protein